MIVDAMGRNTFEKSFSDMGRDAQMAVLKGGMGHLMMGQCLIIEGLLALKKGGLDDGYKEKARRWLDSFRGKAEGERQAGTTSREGGCDTGGSDCACEGSGGVKDSSKPKE